MNNSYGRGGLFLPNSDLPGFVKDVMKEIEREWQFMTVEEFKPVPVSLSLLDGSSLGRDFGDFSRTLKKIEEAINLISDDYYDNFNNSIETYRIVVEKILDAQDRVKTIRSKLHSCKESLQLKQTDILQIWAKSIQYREMLKILDTIEDFRHLPNKVDKLMEGKHYLAAVKYLLNSDKILNGKELSAIGAMSDMKRNIDYKLDGLHEVIIEEIHNQLYLKTPASLNNVGDFLGIHGLEKRALSETSYTQNKNKSDTLTIKKHSNELEFEFDLAVEDLEENPEINGPKFIESLIESLTLIHKLPECIEAIKQRLPLELFYVVDKTIEEFETRGDVTGSLGDDLDIGKLLFDENMQESEVSKAWKRGSQSDTLKSFILLLYSRFESILHIHQFVIDNFRSSAPQGDSDAGQNNYTLREVWLTMQSEVKSLLSDYLYQNQRPQPQHNWSSGENANKRSSRDTQRQLFRFMDSELQEEAELLYKKMCLTGIEATLQGKESLGQKFTNYGTMVVTDKFASKSHTNGHKLLVEPGVFNISAIFQPTVEFMTRMDKLVYQRTSQSPEFLAFLDDFILNFYLPQMQDIVFDQYHKSISGYDAFQQLDFSLTDFSGESRPLLKSTDSLIKLVKRLCKNLRRIPFHRDMYLQMMELILEKYYGSCVSHYKDIISGETFNNSNSKCISSIWVENNQMNELLMQSYHGFIEKNQTEASNDESISEQLWDIENDLKNDRSLHRSELIFDIKDLKLLASMQYSLSWFYREIQKLRDNFVDDYSIEETAIQEHNEGKKLASVRRLSQDSLPPIHFNPDEEISLKLEGENAKRFDTVMSNLKQFSELCLLTLKVELRCHCMYYLDLALREGNYYLYEDNMEPDPYVVNLNSDLSICDQWIRPALSTKEADFIFGGLGSLMKNIVLSNARHIKLLNTFGVCKMVRNLSALQHNLSNIVLTSNSFDIRWDYLQDYFEHYTLGIEGIFNTLRKFGPRYNIQDYIRLFHWIYKTKEFEEESESFHGSYSELSPTSIKSLDGDTVKLNAFFRS